MVGKVLSGKTLHHGKAEAELNDENQKSKDEAHENFQSGAWVRTPLCGLSSCNYDCQENSRFQLDQEIDFISAICLKGDGRGILILEMKIGKNYGDQRKQKKWLGELSAR